MPSLYLFCDVRVTSYRVIGYSLVKMGILSQYFLISKYRDPLARRVFIHYLRLLLENEELLLRASDTSRIRRL